jgi:signal transduction histidine kinase/ligand-binding sensor domain-containing protein/DNA-binding response OmpR family regulator
MNRRAIFFILIVILSVTARVAAQPPAYQFRHLNVNDGLSDNQVSCFFKDKKGFLWIGTSSGLNRFDGYSIKTYLNDSDDPFSISHNSIINLFALPDSRLAVITSKGLNIYDQETERFSTDLSGLYERYNIPSGAILDIRIDRDSNSWFIQPASGITKFDRTNNKSIHLTHSDAPESISSDSVSDFASTPDGSWVIHSNGMLEKIAPARDGYKVVFRSDHLRKANNGSNFGYKLFGDHDGDLWIFCSDDAQGLYFFDHNEHRFRHFRKGSSAPTINADLVSKVVQADNGLIWVGTDHGGINVIDKKDFSIQYILNKPEEEKSISQNTTRTIYKDDDGIMWLGTFKKGVSYYHENLIRFPLYQHYPLATTGLPFADVNRFAEDARGNLWIGTNGGGLIYYDRVNNSYRQFLHDPDDPKSISSNVIVSLFIDYKQQLWIGSYFGGLDLYDGNTFTHFKHDPKNPGSISDQNVWEIFEDSKNRLWIGTMHGGLDLLDRNTNRFSHFNIDQVNSVKSNYIAAITEDSNGNLWMGTDEGVDMLEQKTGRFFHYQSDATRPGSLSDNYVMDVCEDSKGRVWVATKNGLNLFDNSSKTFRSFNSKNGLPSNTVIAILSTETEGIWVSTSNGISNVVATGNEDSLTFRFRNYDESDGLQGKQFNENAAFKTSKGELIFGGANGFNVFYPQRLGINENPPNVVLTDFQLYNRTVQPGEEVDGNVLLSKSLSQTDEIILPPDQNVFSIAFVAINFFNPEKNRYRYMLKGSHAEWLQADSKSRKATFTNLNPGEYTFIVQASNNDGYWNKEGASVKITILPPFWKTRTAFLVYVCFITAALLVTRKLIQHRERGKFDREQERKEAIRMHELDMMKIKFFTNVSHEFRTPLTLILTPLDKMLAQAKEPEQEQQYRLIQRNAKRLLNLVNQLLDFRKLEIQELKLNPSEGDIIRFIEETVFSFSDLSEKKDIKLSFETSLSSHETLFDQDKIEKILFNLLSNAFKFTPDHGAVTVSVNLEHNLDDVILEIRVRDTGIGIEPNKIDKIFDRFFQNELPKSLVNQGSGIGLSITKEFVKIHGGTIAVESEPGVGTCFIVRLPVIELPHHPEVETVSEMPAASNGADGKPRLPVLLLVEDNEDFRFYLKDNLRSQYRIIEAKNGVEAWKMTLEAAPDIIVSDIMMPEMNGIDLCKKIRSDTRVSHTPVILLTAKSAEEQKLEGFESGANDYITKPFNFEILTSRIRNLVQQREKLHKKFAGQIGVKASELKITSLDEKFIQKAIACVEEHISEPEFSVEDLAHELGISRAHFYKKIMMLTGKSPLEFMRMIRLQQAAQLLKKSQLTVAEIAYKVGFNSPKNFARYFRHEYKVLPSVFASDSKKGNPVS